MFWISYSTNKCSWNRHNSVKLLCYYIMCLYILNRLILCACFAYIHSLNKLKMWVLERNASDGVDSINSIQRKCMITYSHRSFVVQTLYSRQNGCIMVSHIIFWQTAFSYVWDNYYTGLSTVHRYRSIIYPWKIRCSGGTPVNRFVCFPWLAVSAPSWILPMHCMID